jgi:MoxR-like ATPase
MPPALPAPNEASNEANKSPSESAAGALAAAATSNDAVLLETAKDASRNLREAIAVRVVGQEAVIELMLVALLARGHALLVGVPGLAKTLLVA